MGALNTRAKLNVLRKPKPLLMFKFVIPADAGIHVFGVGPGFPFSRK
jgi:hypothetical protein